MDVAQIAGDAINMLKESLNLFDEVIKTDRLKLEPVSFAYAQEIFHEFTSEVTKYMHPAPAKKIEDSEMFIAESMAGMERGEELVCVILKKDTGEFLGCAGMHNLNTKTPEPGIWIKTDAHGHGYGIEAVRAMKRWVDQNVVYDYLVYPVVKQNGSSRRIAESLSGTVAREYTQTNLSGHAWEHVEYRIYPLTITATV